VPLTRRNNCIYATLGTCYCVWMSGMQGGMKLHSTLHSRQSSIQNNKYQVSNKYSYFSWWWAHSCPKHVEKRNKHTKKNCAPSWLYLQDYFLSCFHQMDTFTIKTVYQIIIILFQAVTTLFRS